MQPPSEADVVAAIESLETRHHLKMAQVATLQIIQECLASPDFDGALSKAVSAYLGHLATEHLLDAGVLAAQSAHNRMVLEACRSNLILPRVNHRRPAG